MKITKSRWSTSQLLERHEASRSVDLESLCQDNELGSVVKPLRYDRKELGKDIADTKSQEGAGESILRNRAEHRGGHYQNTYNKQRASQDRDQLRVAVTYNCHPEPRAREYEEDGRNQREIGRASCRER